MAWEHQLGNNSTHCGIVLFTSMGTIPLMKIKYVLNKKNLNVNSHKYSIVKRATENSVVCLRVSITRSEVQQTNKRKIRICRDTGGLWNFPPKMQRHITEIIFITSCVWEVYH